MGAPGVAVMNGQSSNLKRKRDSHPSPLAIKKQKLLEIRKQLPIWAHQDEIRAALQHQDVLVLSGETGSGKSTQVPQFLLQAKWCVGQIAVTQPRRVAAISLARRVAEEMGSPLGSSSPASTVGYSVRFDESTSPSTRIKFLTEGMLLQEMLRDATLSQYSCIIVDEVHERSVNVDLIVGFVKSLLDTGKRKAKPLKVVVMSATADVETLATFFSSCPKIDNASHEENAPKPDTYPNARETATNHAYNTRQVSRCQVQGRQYPVKVHYLTTPSDDIIETSLQRIFQVHCKEPMPGDVLVFMTGQETIQSLQKLVEEYASNLTSDFPKMLVLPLFAALPQASQQRIFQPAPRNTRKVILSTNIAETSVTVPGVRFVIDSGKAKVKQFRSRLGLDSLLVKQISRSSADQRKGRAGREAAGQCWRLYTEEAYNAFEKNTSPEILRCDLSEAVLKMKARKIDDVMAFPFLTPPSLEAMEKALLQLLQLDALEDTGKISSIGRQVARLPLTPSLGRVVLEAAKPDMDCVLEVIDIAACLSVESIFLNIDTEGAREQAQVARQGLMRRQGDHLTLLAAVQAYASEHSDRRRWADDHLVSHRAMQSVMDVRKQLTAQCKQAKLIPSDCEPHSTVDEALQERILQCFLRGFPGNVARLCPDGSYRTFVGNQVVAIHPSSVLFGRKVEAILYNEFVYTNKAYARGVSMIQLRWLEELLAGS